MNETGDAVGIYSIGYSLPQAIRGNDWWDKAIVDRWRAMAKLTSVRPLIARETNPDVKLMFRAMVEYEDDPFYGSVSRHVLGPDERMSDVESAAAVDAVERSGVKREDIDLVLQFSQLPDYLTLNTAPIVHKNLGLRPDCMAITLDGACNSFLLQFTVARSMILSGQIRHALLVQSGGLGHLCRPEDSNSTSFGDGATAVVVGRVGKGHGLLGQSHRTDGSYYKALVTGVPNKRWEWRANEGSPFFHAGDPKGVRSTLLKASTGGREVVHEALARAGATVDDVRYYACNQPTPWYRRVTQEQIGLKNARFVDPYQKTASIGAGNIPLMIAMGEREGLLKDGDLIAAYTSGSGITWSSLVIRWGRG